MIDHYVAALALKDQVRTGWRLRAVRDPESVGDHSWGTAYLCLLYAEEAGVGRERAVSMALVHDLAEAITGDVATRASDLPDSLARERKRRIETDAMQKLTGALAGRARDTVRGLWSEYEERETPEARFVRDMNLIDMCAQALCYERDRRYDRETSDAEFPDYDRLDEFFATAEPRLTTTLGKRLFAELHGRYDAIVEHRVADRA